MSLALERNTEKLLLPANICGNGVFKLDRSEKKPFWFFNFYFKLNV